MAKVGEQISVAEMPKIGEQISVSDMPEVGEQVTLSDWQPATREPLDPVQVHKKAVETSEMSTELELPLEDTFNFNRELTATPSERKSVLQSIDYWVDPDKFYREPTGDPFQPATATDPTGIPPQQDDLTRFERYDPTKWQSFKKFWVGDKPSLRPDATRMEKFDRAFDAVVGGTLRVGLKAAKGMTLGAPELMWSAGKRSVHADV